MQKISVLIGSFYNFSQSLQIKSRTCYGRVSMFTIFVVAILLLIGGVEANSGPDHIMCDSLGKWLDSLLIDFRIMRAETHESLAALKVQLEAIMMEVKEKMNTITIRRIISKERIATIERVLATNNTLLQEGKNEIVMVCASLDLLKLHQLPETHILYSNLSLTQTSNTSPSKNNESLNIALLVCEAMESEKLKRNAIIFNLPVNDSFIRAKHMLHNLFLYLKCNDIIIQSITRFRRQTIKPRPLRTELRSQRNFLAPLKADYKLVSLRNIWHNTSISIDSCEAELEIHRKLTKELHQRREKGENLFPINGKLVSVVPHTSHSATSQNTTNQSRVTATEG